ncbi:hypothetical protein E1B28_009690 [Marasmius oreades]|uniref:Uncharacterized protein n=1 Tax=Marasmius oreades TaxID=181124 RepID=A0A9P7RVL7_9AGAR|nr:uncharacterized protein E1B28_009690 [Marasmius oreades]KAG7090584.1 hypothetical protein E1B28_009690 [Marasmius oreades]
MPSVSPRATRATRKAAASSSESHDSKRLRPATPQDLREGESSGDESLPEDLDDGWGYTFQAGESVWVRTAGGNWLRGKVCGDITRKGRTRTTEGLFYPVKFDNKLRKYFAPLNGEIKPDTPHTRRLLKEAGYVDI